MVDQLFLLKINSTKMTIIKKAPNYFQHSL